MPPLSSKFWKWSASVSRIQCATVAISCEKYCLRWFASPAIYWNVATCMLLNGHVIWILKQDGCYYSQSNLRFRAHVLAVPPIRKLKTKISFIDKMREWYANIYDIRTYVGVGISCWLLVHTISNRWNQIEEYCALEHDSRSSAILGISIISTISNSLARQTVWTRWQFSMRIIKK